MQLRGTNFCTGSARFAPSFVREPNSSKSTQMVRNSPKHEFLGSSGVDRVHLLRKILMRLRGTKCCTSSARFAPCFVRLQMFPNAPKWYETHPNMSLGSNEVDRVHSLQKIPMRLRVTNSCTSSARFAPSFVRQPNGPECTQVVQNAQKRQFRVQCGGLGAFVAKNSDATSRHELLH